MRFRNLVKRAADRRRRRRRERRDERRVERFGWARYDSGEVEGQGLVTNLSLTGAMLERCSEPLDPEAKLVLRLKPAGGYQTICMDAAVVRATEEGFALDFSEASEEAMDLLSGAIEAALGHA